MELHDGIKIGDYVQFRARVHEHPAYAPYYEAYKGHTFIVTALPYRGHASLVCDDDDTVIVKGAVHTTDLAAANSTV